MSRLSKKPILIPDNVEVKKEDNQFMVKGPLGELSRSFKNEIEISIDGKEINLKIKKETKEAPMLIGTYVSHLRNMIEGVTKGYEKKLIVEGIGYRAQMQDNVLFLSLGFSHPVKIEIPKDLKVAVENNIITISGIDKENVGNFAAKIRELKKPEPYKGKGIRYENEVIRRKAGKKQA
ncbi:MAG: 50S ribosomal protein L6 [Patescibacteria group bacterium]